MAKKKTENKCFIITPIGDRDSNVRRSTDGLINTVLRPLLVDEFDFHDIKAAHEINASGSINNQIMKRIIYDDLVLANLTGLNPNVMYEVAVRHATLKPIIHICEEGTKLPFDIIDQRTIFFKNDMLGVQELKGQLKLMIKEAIKEKEFVDNPIYNASQSKIFLESISNNPEKNIEKYLLERLDKLESNITGKQQNELSKIDIKFSEPFKIDLVIKGTTDHDYLYNELMIGLIKQNYSLQLFKIEKLEVKSDITHIKMNIIVNSKIYLPITNDLKDIFNKMAFTQVEKIEIEGNELPF